MRIGQRIHPLATQKRIGTRAAFNDIIIRPAFNDIIAIHAVDHIIAPSANHMVIKAITDQNIIFFRAGEEDFKMAYAAAYTAASPAASSIATSAAATAAAFINGGKMQGELRLLAGITAIRNRIRECRLTCR